MKEEKVQKYLEKTKEIVIFLLLMIWFLIPVFKEIVNVSLITIRYEYVFIELIGVIGIYMICLDFYKNYNERENKKQYIKQILPIIIFVLYMLWTLISCFTSSNKEYAFYGTQFRRDGYITYIAYGAFFSIAFLLGSKKIKKILLNIFLISAVSTIILMELANNKILYQVFWMKDVTIGVFDNSNHYGYYLLIAIMVSNMLYLTEKNKLIKIVYAAVYAFLLYYLIYNDTLGCYLALFISLMMILVYCVYKKKKICLAIISIVIFIIMSCMVQKWGTNIVIYNIKSFFPDFNAIIESLENRDDKEKEKRAGQAGSGRIKLWKNGIKFFFERPILGYGPENLREKYKEVGINQDRAHNLIIQQATTSGLPGLVLYLLAIGIILKKAFIKMKKDDENTFLTITFFTVCAYLISAMFGNSMYYTSPYFFIILGFLMYETIDKTKEERINEKMKGELDEK